PSARDSRRSRGGAPSGSARRGGAARSSLDRSAVAPRPTGARDAFGPARALAAVRLRGAGAKAAGRRARGARGVDADGRGPPRLVGADTATGLGALTGPIRRRADALRPARALAVGQTVVSDPAA